MAILAPSPLFETRFRRFRRFETIQLPTFYNVCHSDVLSRNKHKLAASLEVVQLSFHVLLCLFGNIVPLLCNLPRLGTRVILRKEVLITQGQLQCYFDDPSLPPLSHSLPTSSTVLTNPSTLGPLSQPISNPRNPRPLTLNPQ